jgi:outer membrane protein OmpA-like peptidoglycan-associated protein
MSGELVVLGFFRGRYNTDQGVALGLTDSFPQSEAHKVNIYEGKLKNTSFFNEYSPHEYLKLKSLELSNVPNIEIDAGTDSQFSGSRVYNCQKLIIIDPKILSAYDLNGKTYGEIEGQAYGLTEKHPSVKRLNPDDIGNNTGNGSFPPDPNDGGSNGTNPVVTPIPPRPTDYDPVPDPMMKGCRDGCLGSIWKILRYLMLFLLLWFLFKACNRITKDNSICDKAEIIRKKSILEKSRLDSITGTMNTIIEQAIANISVVYFYQNTTDFHINSLGVNGTLDRLSSILKSFPKSRFTITGYHSGTGIEDVGLDQKRAEKVFDYLVKNGVDKKQLDVIGKADQPLIDGNEVSHDFEGRGFNRNMRVEINLIK